MVCCLRFSHWRRTNHSLPLVSNFNTFLCLYITCYAAPRRPRSTLGARTAFAWRPRTWPLTTAAPHSFPNLPRPSFLSMTARPVGTGTTTMTTVGSMRRALPWATTAPGMLGARLDFARGAFVAQAPVLTQRRRVFRARPACALLPTEPRTTRPARA